MEKTNSTIQQSGFGGVGKDLNSASDLAMDAIILISKTPIKNKSMGENFGNSLNFIIEALNQQIDFQDHDKSFKMYHKVSIFKQLATKVWHGSVIGSILDGNVDLLNMITVGEQISNSVELRQDTQRAAQLWKDFRDRANAQKTANLAELFKGKAPGEQLTDREIDKIIEVYDTTVEAVEEDVQRFYRVGYNAEFLSVTNQFKDIFYI